MSDLITLQALDSDGAIQEAAEEANVATRGEFFRKAGVAGGSLLAGGVLMGGLPSLASAAKSKTQDIAILNFALTLEYLESSFYNEAIRKRALTGDVLAVTRIIQAHENAHVTFLQKALGRKAVKRPRFDFRDTTENQNKFVKTSIALEDTGVKAYSGQATNFLNPAYLKAAVSILTVEARHASAARRLGKANFAPRAFDIAAGKPTILKAVAATKFIQN